MKTKLTLALVALITSSAFAAIPKVLPEFKNEKQLAEWRAEMAAKHAATSTSDVRSSTLDVPSAFYTGKPYIETTGSYAFKYRSYNPELARWMSEDPSGFPDGANNSAYLPVPTTAFDSYGLFAVDINGFGTPQTSRYTNTSTNITYSVTTLSAEILTASDFSESFAGWTFAAGESNATMKISDYTPVAFDDYGSTNFWATVSGLSLSNNYDWIQVVTCNTPGNANRTGTFLDNPLDNSNPLYRGQKTTSSIFDCPARAYTDFAQTSGGAISWEAKTFFAHYDGQSVSVFGGVKWGFTITAE